MKTNQPIFYFASADEAETAFYSAFKMGDIQLMDAVLAELNVCCIHPGSLPIVGRETVLDSWTQILSNIKKTVISPEILNRSVFDDVAVHLVAEHIAADHQPGTDVSLVLATNVYVRQQNGWRMLEHHASLPANQKNMTAKNKDPVVTHEAPDALQ